MPKARNEAERLANNAYNVAYRRSHHAELRAYARRYYQAQRKGILEKWRDRLRNDLDFRTARWASLQTRRGSPPDAEAIEYAKMLMQDPCAYCGSPPPSQVEHIVAISQGGKTDVGNLTASCPQCNQRKARKPLLQFLAQRMAPLTKNTLWTREWYASNREQILARRRARWSERKGTV